MSIKTVLVVSLPVRQHDTASLKMCQSKCTQQQCHVSRMKLLHVIILYGKA